MVRGVTLVGQKIGGQTSLQALNHVQRQWGVFTHGAFHFHLGGEDVAINSAGASATETEVVFDVATLNIPTAVNQAFDFGHTGPWWTKARQRLSGFLGRRHEFGRLVLNTSALSDGLKQQLSDHDTAPINAGLKMNGNNVQSVTASINGQTVDYAGAVKEAVRRARRLDPTPVSLHALTLAPAIPSTPTLLTLAQTQAPLLLAKAPLTLQSGDKSWTITSQQLAPLIGFSRNQAGQVRVGFDVEKTTAYLKKIAKDIEVSPKNAKLTLVNGKIQEFQTSVIGKTLDINTSLATLERSVVDQGQATIALVVGDIQPATSSLANNDLGITELVAEATTNFRGSPTNRRFNLSYGAQILNGLLIAPGENFSLVKALGPIDAKHGWKPELVIKGSDITPEFGGGLCQVGTTMFRVALNAGVPIVERTNHSLRIRYYEPPVGLDATIYEPKPDFRFTNDYEHYLLLQTEVSGDNITFRFYGTKDGRTSDVPTPKVFNQTAIPPTKNIEVDDLKPGQKECQTPGHPGADAIATYTVTKADGTKVVQTFKSHYKALPVICRVGKKATPPVTAS